MDEDDINPKKCLPMPYIKERERILVPKLNITSPTPSCKPLNVCPDPGLEVTPLKRYTRRTVVQKSNNKHKPCASKRKENVRVECINPWTSSTTNRTQWVGYDHLRGEKVEKNYRTATENATFSRSRLPTFYNSLCPKSDLPENGSKHIPVPITKTDEEKFHKPEFNSCLKLAEEIKHLKIVQKGVDNEIAKQIKSDRIRKEVSEKASVQVNIPFTEQQFKNLIPVDVSPCELAMKLQEEKEIKMKACKPQPRPRDPEPNITDFHSNIIYREHCNIHLEIPRLDLNTPELAPPDWTLRHYQQLLERDEPV